ncbi:sigma factor-like helix-turn-helix DNA-binding protein [Streptomyces sp. NPDC002221]|uniref:sigma-70 region 4 domain-containing protein n=1 Tax=Streptomyces sp. NPDC002221 TaxID=3364639 RepID=UPI0036C5A5EB
MTAYDRALVEHLLPAVWDDEAAFGIRNLQAPDADMPKGSVDPKTASLLFAHLADIRRGWVTAPLTVAERQAIILRYGVDLPDAEAAALQGVTDRAVRYRLERGVGKVAAHLNGHDYIDGYDTAESAA